MAWSDVLVFTRVWEYDVPPAHVADFVAAYGPDGDWARLFGTADGYLSTDLYRSTDIPGRFLTVDRWADEASWQAFVAASSSAYDALDVRLTRLADGGRLVLEDST